MKEAESGVIDQDLVRDSAADFAHHRGARDFTRRRGAHPDPAPTLDPQGATEEAQIHRGLVIVPHPGATLCSPTDLGTLGSSPEIAVGEEAGRVSQFAFG
jgi:hypothetical protein